MMSASTIVRHRNVYYFSGFDPRGATYYYRLFRKESRKAGFANDDSYRADRHSHGRHFLRWEASCAAILAPSSNAPVERIVVNHFFMKWDDVIRDHWKKFSWTFLIDCISVYAASIRKIPLDQIWRIHKGAFWAGLMPGLFSIATLLLSAAAGLLAHSLGTAVLEDANRQTNDLATLFGVLISLLILATVAQLGRKTGLHWLIQIFRFNLAYGSRPIPAIDQRQREWAEAIFQQQQMHPSDEVIFVGHSVGTIVMLEVLRMLMTDPRWTILGGASPTRLITLGHCLPFISLNPKAEHFRETLNVLCKNQNVAWWDVTAKIDPLCFYQTLPMATKGSSSPAVEMQRKPILLAARFFRMYGRERWRRLRRNKLQLHFLYLMCPDIESGFNLYRAIQGPQNFDHYMNSLRHA